MNANNAAFPALASPTLPRLGQTPVRSATPVHSATPETADQVRGPDLAIGASSMRSTAMSYAISPRSNSITLTLSDQTSGEVFRRLVYDRGAHLPVSLQGKLGQRIDIAT